MQADLGIFCLNIMPKDHFAHSWLIFYLSWGTAFPTRLDVRWAKSQISLRIHADLSVIAVSLKTLWILGYCTLRKLISDRARNAQADLNLHWVQMQSCRKCCARLFCHYYTKVYRIRPNYRTVRLGFSKLLENTCGKICICLLKGTLKKKSAKNLLDDVYAIFFWISL